MEGGSHERNGLHERVRILLDEVGWLRQTRHQHVEKLASHEERLRELGEDNRELKAALQQSIATQAKTIQELAGLRSQVRLAALLGAAAPGVVTAIVALIALVG